jgi:hypothetical protein
VTRAEHTPESAPRAAGSPFGAQFPSPSPVRRSRPLATLAPFPAELVPPMGRGVCDEACPGSAKSERDRGKRMGGYYSNNSSRGTPYALAIFVTVGM